MTTMAKVQKLRPSIPSEQEKKRIGPFVGRWQKGCCVNPRHVRRVA